jgi:hypothetical protein
MSCNAIPCCHSQYELRNVGLSNIRLTVKVSRITSGKNNREINISVLRCSYTILITKGLFLLLFPCFGLRDYIYSPYLINMGRLDNYFWLRIHI